MGGQNESRKIPHGEEGGTHKEAQRALVSLILEYMGTPLYEAALEIAEAHSDDFEVQEAYIEGIIRGYLLVMGRPVSEADG